ncbi:hypothetical protein L1049_002614 [Liquidambar formosana]|uniref:H15 domain-containing protein n=1 Tax=Liquidambar formosana TaxID=63359 RepID=A0AAP0NGD1_LIQFO
MATEEVDKAPSLPPYSEMILSAIEALNEKEGSNRSSISKYIESTYRDLPTGHSTLLLQHLNRMNENGELIMVKTNYMKSNPNAPLRQGRGRPPKTKTTTDAPLPPGAVLPPPRPRGRPRKDPSAPAMMSKERAFSGSGRPHGRPPKKDRVVRNSGGLATMTTTGRSRGRPPKVKPLLTEVNLELK